MVQLNEDLLEQLDRRATREGVSRSSLKADVIPVTPASPTSERLATEWEVQPGDHLWSVAEQALGQAGATHGDGEVAQYWLRLIEANAGRLADPANPDLIFPGQFLTLPALSSSGEGALP